MQSCVSGASESPNRAVFWAQFVADASDLSVRRPITAPGAAAAGARRCWINPIDRYSLTTPSRPPRPKLGDFAKPKPSCRKQICSRRKARWFSHDDGPISSRISLNRSCACAKATAGNSLERSDRRRDGRGDRVAAGDGVCDQFRAGAHAAAWALHRDHRRIPGLRCLAAAGCHRRAHRRVHAHPLRDRRKRHGYEGLAVATVMAGLILIIMGVAQLGSMIKFIPYPVTTGFTAGIARDHLQLADEGLLRPAHGQPAAGVSSVKWQDYFRAFRAARRQLVLRRRLQWAAWPGDRAAAKFAPRIPGAIVAVDPCRGGCRASSPGRQAQVGRARRSRRSARSSAESRRRCPTPHSCDIVHSVHVRQDVRELIPEATTIALLAAIESLLCCVVADGMIGGRHKSNVELIAQGMGNIGSILFGGIPATGAIARTAANVKSGGRTPLAGMIHSVFVLLCMLALAPLAAKIPMADLRFGPGRGRVEHEREGSFHAPVPRSAFGHRRPAHDFRIDRAGGSHLAVGIGMVLAAMLFMKRMSEVTNVGALTRGDRRTRQ